MDIMDRELIMFVFKMCVKVRVLKILILINFKEVRS